MKPVAAVSLIALAVALLLPVLWPAPADQVPVEPVSPATADSGVTLTVLRDGGLVETTMADYLPGVLAGEMPALFELEALKAQAVAARTYMLYRSAHRPDAHPDADVCDDPTCCKAWASEDSLQEKWGALYDTYAAKMTTAVRDTDGQYLRYAGQPIQAVFHASSPGRTQASGEIWNDCPYLVSVSSPETAEAVPGLVSEVEVSRGDFHDRLAETYPDMVFPDDPAAWVAGTVENTSGRADYTTVCATDIPGTQMRSLFSLRSAAYTLAYTHRDTFLFTVTGYGHGVGMSQYGANLYARSGMTYDAILAHYYPGTELVSP